MYISTQPKHEILVKLRVVTCLLGVFYKSVNKYVHVTYMVIRVLQHLLILWSYCILCQETPHWHVILST